MCRILSLNFIYIFFLIAFIPGITLPAITHQTYGAIELNLTLQPTVWDTYTPNEKIEFKKEIFPA